MELSIFTTSRRLQHLTKKRKTTILFPQRKMIDVLRDTLLMKNCSKILLKTKVILSICLWGCYCADFLYIVCSTVFPHAWVRIFVLVGQFSLIRKEFLVALTVVQNWRYCVQGAWFISKTNHISLTILLEHRLNRTLQHKGLCKLLRLDYTIQYKKRRVPDQHEQTTT